MRWYPEYKESDAEFIGEIPKDWNTMRCAHLFEVKHIKQTSGEINLSVYRDYGVIKRDSRDDNYNRVSEDTSNYKLVEPGDFVFNKMKCWQGSLGVSEYRGIVSPSYTVCEPKRHFHGKYFHYLLRSQPYIQEFNRLSYGVRIGQWELRFEDLKDIVVPYPPLSEQTQIANFLDHKTGQIDELLRIKQRRIELLQEQRTALINQAVTKGLDPNVEMKPSGAEWIGEIPAHWEVKRVKYLASLISKGTTPTTIGREILDEGEIRFIKAENIVDNQIELKPEYYIDEKTNQMLKRSQLKENDLLFVIAGATIGKVSLVNPNHLPANTNQAVSFIRPHEKELPEFIYYWLQSDNIQKMIWLKAVQSAQPNLSMEDLGNLYIPYPNIAEQRRIVDYIADKTQTIVQLLQQIYKQIGFLKEYRQSLISEAVTGKIDVRSEV